MPPERGASLAHACTAMSTLSSTGIRPRACASAGRLGEGNDFRLAQLRHSKNSRQVFPRWAPSAPTRSSEPPRLSWQPARLNTQCNGTSRMRLLVPPRWIPPKLPRAGAIRHRLLQVATVVPSLCAGLRFATQHPAPRSAQLLPGRAPCHWHAPSSARRRHTGWGTPQSHTGAGPVLLAWALPLWSVGPRQRRPNCLRSEPKRMHKGTRRPTPHGRNPPKTQGFHHHQHHHHQDVDPHAVLDIDRAARQCLQSDLTSSSHARLAACGRRPRYTRARASAAADTMCNAARIAVSFAACSRPPTAGCESLPY